MAFFKNTHPHVLFLFPTFLLLDKDVKGLHGHSRIARESATP